MSEPYGKHSKGRKPRNFYGVLFYGADAVRDKITEIVYENVSSISMHNVKSLRVIEAKEKLVPLWHLSSGF